MKDIRDLDLDGLKAELEALGERPFRAVQIFDWLYHKRPASFEGFTSLSRDLRAKLAGHFMMARPEVETRLAAHDGTAKLVLRLADGAFVETVRIPSGDRNTICLSTQVGCKFGCTFCASGRHGFKRNLAPSEIVGQVFAVEEAFAVEITNYVFMGMGEPLDNFDNLATTLRIMNAPEGMGVAARRMTISTAGLVPGILKLATLDLQINLSVSLHAATDTLRDKLMPINRRYPLERLVAACEEYIQGGGRMITLEYTVIKDVNDGLDDADGLAAIARRLKAKVNLIAYSPGCGPGYETPDDPDVARFKRRLEERRTNVTLRQSKGKEIFAACGQLAGRLK